MAKQVTQGKWRPSKWRGVVQERLKQDFTKEQHRQVADFYFNHYRTHFMSKPSLADALASIPQVQQVRHAMRYPSAIKRMIFLVVTVMQVC